MKPTNFMRIAAFILVLALAPAAVRAEATPAPATAPTIAADLAAKVAPASTAAANAAAATANAPSAAAAEADKTIGMPGSKNPAEPGAAPAAAATGQAPGTTPEAAPAETVFRYDASLPDPFAPYSEPILKCLGAGETPPAGYVPPEECGDEIKEPLEMFDLNQLQVLGIIWGIRDSRAKIKDPESNYWTVRVGQKIGKNRGRIKAIREGEIEIEERFWDDNLRAYQKITSTMSMSSK